MGCCRVFSGLASSLDLIIYELRHLKSSDKGTFFIVQLLCRKSGSIVLTNISAPLKKGVLEKQNCFVSNVNSMPL